MGHTTIYADQESILGFINGRIDMGDADATILAASRSVDAILELGHVVTAEDFINAVNYLRLVLEDEGPVPSTPMGCIAFIRQVFVLPEGVRRLSA